jgi:hypothetical protein
MAAELSRQVIGNKRTFRTSEMGRPRTETTAVLCDEKFPNLAHHSGADRLLSGRCGHGGRPAAAPGLNRDDRQQWRLSCRWTRRLAPATRALTRTCGCQSLLDPSLLIGGSLLHLVAGVTSKDQHTILRQRSFLLLRERFQSFRQLVRHTHSDCGRLRVHGVRTY